MKRTLALVNGRKSPTKCSGAFRAACRVVGGSADKCHAIFFKAKS